MKETTKGGKHTLSKTAKLQTKGDPESEVMECWLPKTVKPEVWLLEYMEETYKSREADRKRLTEQIYTDLEHGTGDRADQLKLTLNYLNNHPPQSQKMEFDAAMIDALAANLQRCVSHLEELSQRGDVAAITLLAQHTLHLSSWLSATRKKNPDVLRPVARTSIFWPVLKSRCQHFDDIGKASNNADAIFLRNLEVGFDHPIKGRKIDFTDELGVLVLELIVQIESFKASSHPFLPTRWQSKALELPRLSSCKAVLDKWVDGMDLALLDRFSSRHEMAEKYKHLVSPTKRGGDGTILSEFRVLMKRKLSRAAGASCHRNDTTPSSNWLNSRTKNIQKRAAKLP